MANSIFSLLQVYGSFVNVPTIVKNVSLESNPVRQISAGNGHWVAWTTPPVSAGTAGQSHFHGLGVPAKVPAKYTKLSGQSLTAMRARLFTLKQVTALIESTWRCFAYSSHNHRVGYFKLHTAFLEL